MNEIDKEEDRMIKDIDWNRTVITFTEENNSRANPSTPEECSTTSEYQMNINTDKRLKRKISRREEDTEE